MKKIWMLLTSIVTLFSLGIGWLMGSQYGLPDFTNNAIFSPLVEQTVEKAKPLQKLSIANLQNYPFEASKIVIEDTIDSDPAFTSYLFSYQTYNKKMTGQINIPTQPAPADGFPVILMMRGWAPEESYTTGTGTRPAATVLARNGYVTIAPDFFGYGGSDPDVENTWESRFIKPVNVIELLKTVEAQESVTIEEQTVPFDSNRVGFWAHSNGGQITLTTLEILERPIPTTLWAPVTAPFPYSLLFFTDEDYDEGKDFRKIIAEFETDYDVFEFSFTRNLEKLTGTIRIHQGTADDAVPVAWSREFVQKVEQENQRREHILEERQKITTPSAEPQEQLLPLVDIELLVYPGMDHNMRPAWDTVVQRDLAFFSEQLR